MLSRYLHSSNPAPVKKSANLIGLKLIVDHHPHQSKPSSRIFCPRVGLKGLKKGCKNDRITKIHRAASVGPIAWLAAVCSPAKSDDYKPPQCPSLDAAASQLPVCDWILFRLRLSQNPSLPNRIPTPETSSLSNFTLLRCFLLQAWLSHWFLTMKTPMKKIAQPEGI